MAGSGVYSFADGAGAAAAFSYPTGVAVDASGNVLVADSNNHRVRRVTPSGGNVFGFIVFLNRNVHCRVR